MIIRKLIATTLLLSLLSACGFALRGSSSADLAPELQTLQVQGSNTEIMRLLQRALASNRITVINQAQPGVYRLEIGSEQVAERVISVNSSARAGEYELSMILPFQLSSDSEFIIAPENLSIERSYQADPSSAVAKADESQLILKEMRQGLVTQILRRLQTLSFTPEQLPD